MNPISNPQLPESPSAEDVIIHLICEELKSRKFFGGLRELGLDDDFYQVDLMELIMTLAGLKYGSQADYNFCLALLKNHSRRVVQDVDEVWEEASRVAEILVKRGETSRGPQSTVHGPRMNAKKS